MIVLDNVNIESQVNGVSANVNAVTAGNNVLHFAAVPAGIVPGMIVSDTTTPNIIPNETVVQSVTSTTVTMSNNAVGAGIGATEAIKFQQYAFFEFRYVPQE
jgi:hypothetical protein